MMRVSHERVGSLRGLAGRRHAFTGAFIDATLGRTGAGYALPRNVARAASFCGRMAMITI